MASALEVAAAARSIAGNAKARMLEAVGGSYPRDVATAAASLEATAGDET